MIGEWKDCRRGARGWAYQLHRSTIATYLINRKILRPSIPRQPLRNRRLPGAEWSADDYKVRHVEHRESDLTPLFRHHYSIQKTSPFNRINNHVT